MRISSSPGLRPWEKHQSRISSSLPAGQGPLDDGLVADAEQAAAAAVEPGGIGVVAQEIAGTELAGGVEPDFVEHAAKENDAADHFVGAAGHGKTGGG